MPCIFLRYIPLDFDSLTRLTYWNALVANMYQGIAEAAGCEVDQVEIHLSNENFCLLSPDGKMLRCPNVHGEVEWFGSENRDLATKQKIANALQDFLDECQVGKGFNLAFHDFPAGSFFVEKDGKSQMVEGGEFLPSNKAISQTVYIALGVETPGVTIND
jgi:hypothetical protein